MTSLTFYGGVGEIGGNKILLEEGKTKIFFDFGMSFKQNDQFFSEFIQPRKANGLGDFIALDLIPMPSWYSGLYRSDFLKHDGRKTSNEAMFDGVFISHAHLDHMGYITLLHEKAEIYSSEISYCIMKTLEETGTGSFNDFTNYSRCFEYVPKKRGEGVIRGRGLKDKRKCNIFNSNTGFEIGDVKIKTAYVDHSLQGACGYIAETSAGNVVYTGDLRFHGYRSDNTEGFVKLAADASPRVLLCEGTRIDEGKGLTEEGVKERINEVIVKTKQLVAVNFPARDTDRLNTFFDAAKENGRKLVISLKQAYLLELLKDIEDSKVPKIENKDLLIYGKKKSWGLVAEEVDTKEKQKDYASWERGFLEKENFVTHKDISGMQKDVVFYLDNYSIQELVNIKPEKGSCYIRSMCEPFDIEMEIDWNRIKNWLERFNLEEIHQIHASGHASGEELKELIEEINPEIIFPIHTKDPARFNEILDGERIKIVLPEKKKPYSL
ncbi:MAG: MBL fold metallo-hydrolase RNA specificity domain-containing protein [Candidatus Hydrothermarchaeales archaeon]